jgi:uncharacterized protein YndB with AHSA1/START domain
MKLVDLTVEIDASPDTVFDLFTTNEGLCEWMAVEADVDARPGGRWRWVHENGAACSGVYLELQRPHRLSFTYGWESGPFEEIAPGSTRVDVSLERTARGTRLDLVHHGMPDAYVEDHRRGWGHFIGLLADRVAAHASPPVVEPTADSKERH